MPVEPADLRDLAGKLARDTSDEVELRASISRAYYACYHALRPFAEMLPPTPKCPTETSHLGHKEMCGRISAWKVDGLPGNLKQMVATKGQLSRAIDLSRAMRGRADYNLAETLTLIDAQQQHERARLILRQAALVEAELGRKPSAPAAAVSGD